MTILIAGALTDAGRAICRALRPKRLILVDEDIAACRAFAAELGSPAIPADALGNIKAASGDDLDLVVCCVERQRALTILADVPDWEVRFDRVTRQPWRIMQAVAPVLKRSGGRWVSILPTSNDATFAATSFLTQALGQEIGEGSAIVLRGDDAEACGSAVAMLASSRVSAAGELTIGRPYHDASRARGGDSEARAPSIPRRIIVTAGGGLIARALCRQLLRDNGTLDALLVDRDSDQLAAAAADLQAEGASIETMVADLADASVPAEIVARSVAAFGGLDAVFSHAGVGRPDLVSTTGAADFEVSFAVNLRATWLLAKAAFPWLAAQGGSMVATGTIGALRPGMSAPIYSASKAALLTLVEQLALELGPVGVRINAVSPGSTLTPMNRLWSADPGERARIVAGYPLGRMAAPEEIAAAAAFLVSPAAGYVSGHNLVADGALSLRQ